MSPAPRPHRRDPAEPGASLHELRKLGLLAAGSGDRRGVATVIDRLHGLAPPPRVAATAARLWWVLGDAAAALRCLDRGLRAHPPDPDRVDPDRVDPDLAAVATLALPDGERWGRARLAAHTPGLRADAACDLAWRCLDRGDEAGARAWVDSALDGCPDHAEALHWRRFLSDHPGAARAIVAAVAEDPAAPGWADIFALVPTATRGWLSGSRLRRRVHCPAPTAAPPAEVASAWLRDRGVTSRILATDEDYGRVSPGHPRVACEQALDLALDLDAEHRSAAPAAARLWTLARGHERQAAPDAGRALIALGCRHADIRALALQAAELLLSREPATGPWAAGRFRLLALGGHRRRALAAMGDLGPVAHLDPTSFTLVVHGLRDLAEHRRARRLLREARRHPHLRRRVPCLQDHPDDGGGIIALLAERRSPGAGGLRRIFRRSGEFLW